MAGEKLTCNQRIETELAEIGTGHLGHRRRHARIGFVINDQHAARFHDQPVNASCDGYRSVVPTTLSEDRYLAAGVGAEQVRKLGARKDGFCFGRESRVIAMGQQ
jgi:hypothetical protein